MLSDPLVLPFEAYLYDVAKRPEFTVDCRWLTENDLFIIFDILTPGPETYGAPMAFCPITGEPVTLRRFRTPNNRPYLPLGGWTGDVVDSENNQFTYVERYFIWVNRDGSGVREGSARWPPASARKKRHLEKSSALPILSLPSGTPKEQYSVVIGLDNGLEKDHKNGEQPECTRSHPKCLKTLEKHIKYKR
ncbi:hypothetical protein BDZ91DRAFT_235851 [Kalaharituber pfeilii]|nr:hypothetical protein BDZ91DRAFT_235851 [Kalaharituber pfeilii]